MKKDDAERAIIAEMRQRLPRVPYKGADGAMRQFNELQAERPELFAFRSPVEKWQLVQGWMKKHKLTG